MIKLVLCVVFIIFCIFLTAYFEKKTYNRERARLIEEIRSECQDSKFDMCENCYYKKRCEELERK